MQPPNVVSAAQEPFSSVNITPGLAEKDEPGSTPSPVTPADALPVRTTPVQIIVAGLGVVVFLYFARPVVLPVVLACVAGMTLKPLIRWLSCCHIPPVISAAVVVCLLVCAIGICFFELGRPALKWMDEAPQHMIELRQRVQNIFPRLTGFDKAAAAVNDLGATDNDQKKPTMVEVKTSRVPGALINW